MKILYKIFFSILFLFACILKSSIAFAWEQESWTWVQETKTLELHSADENAEDSHKTIKENIKELRKLQSEKKAARNQFRDFIKKNGRLKTYFREKLSVDEWKKIEIILKSYNFKRLKLEKNLKQGIGDLRDTKNLKIELLELRKDLYISFLPFIEISKINGYEVFIENDISSEKKNKNIESSIYAKEKIIDTKVSVIQKKINKNKKELNEKLHRALEQKIKKKLSYYKQSETIQGLSVKMQKKLFTKVLEKIQERGMKEKNEKKKGLLKIIEKELKIFIGEFNA